MIKQGGYIVIDDIDWCYTISPTSKPVKEPIVAQLYTEKQIETYQVAMVNDIFVKDDSAWELVKGYSSPHRKTYKRIK